MAVSPWPHFDFRLCVLLCSHLNGGKVENEIFLNTDLMNLIYIYFQKDRGGYWNRALVGMSMVCYIILTTLSPTY